MATTATQIFPWRKEYSVSIPQIDAQHQQLVALINELHMAMMEGNGKPALAHILAELVRYAENHFTYEETMLQQRGYSGLAGHRLEHKAWIGQVYELRDQFASGKMMLTIKVM